MAKKKQLERLSEFEWAVMAALWRLGRPATVSEVTDEMDLEFERDYRTIQTWIMRIHRKGWLTPKDRSTRPILYRADVTMEDGLALRTRWFLEPLGGDLKAMRVVRDTVLERLREVRATRKKAAKKKPRRRPKTSR